MGAQAVWAKRPLDDYRLVVEFGRRTKAGLAEQSSFREGDLTEYHSLAEHLKHLLSALDEAGEALAAIKVAEAIELLPSDDDNGMVRGANDE